MQITTDFFRFVDTSLKDGLFHEYKKHGKVTSVKVIGAASDRYALVCFKKPDDVVKAIEVSRDKSFFGCLIDVSPYHGYASLPTNVLIACWMCVGVASIVLSGTQLSVKGL